MSNYPENSTENLIGEWVEVWVPDYSADHGTCWNGATHKHEPWSKLTRAQLYHGRTGLVVDCDEPNPEWGLAAFKVQFENGDYVWCWRRELRPSKEIWKQTQLL